MIEAAGTNDVIARLQGYKVRSVQQPIGKGVPIRVEVILRKKRAVSFVEMRITVYGDHEKR